MKKKYYIIIGVVLVLWILGHFTNSNDTDVAEAESTQTEINTEQETEPQTQPTEVATELNVDDLTEEEYKAMCEEVYDNHDTKLKEVLHEGQLVKLNVYLQERVVFYETNLFYDTPYSIEDFECVYYVCRVGDEGSSPDSLSGYGDEIEIYFPIDGVVSSSDLQVGQTAVLYGEVFCVMEYSGVFIIPKYMESVTSWGI